MRRPRYLTFQCPTCQHMEERFLETNDDDSPCEEQHCNGDLDATVACEAPCGATCGEVMEQIDGVFNGYMKTITKGNEDFAERERERLEKRQDDHWRRSGRDEAIDRERAYLKKHGAVGGVK
jgi:hypothetical protein